MNGAYTGSDVKVKGKKYLNGGFAGMLNAVGGDYSSAEVKQDDIDWYGVGITRKGDSYSLSYIEGKGYNKDNGFDPKTGTEYKNESWPES